MKIKILVYVPRQDVGMMVDLQPGEVMFVDDSVGQALVDNGKAEYEI